MNTAIEKIINTFKIDKRITVAEISIEDDGKSLCVNGLIQNQILKENVIGFCNEYFKRFIKDNLEVISEGKLYGLIRVSVASLHKEPSFSSPLVTQSLMGTVVSIIKTSGDWLYIQLPDGYLGWVSETVRIISDEQYKRWIELPKVIVIKMNDWAYSAVKMDCVISDIVIGDVFAVKNELDNWYEIIYPDNRVAYIKKGSGQLLKEWIFSRVLSEETIVKTAEQFTGIPYLWGGASSKAVDCSGFVKMIYFLNGILLPRDADQQALIGNEVIADTEFTNIRPGDLLFFGRKKDDTSVIPITHVGLSLGGKKFIQASGDVHLSSFDTNDNEFDKRRTESLLRIRRIIGTDGTVENLSYKWACHNIYKIKE